MLHKSRVKIGEFFYLDEFLVTNTGLVNVMPDRYINNIKHVVDSCLDPIRRKWGKISINSCYRSPNVNSKVGGVPSSKHLTAEGVDFTPLEATLDEVFAWIQTNLRVDWAKRYPTHIHISKGNG